MEKRKITLELSDSETSHDVRFFSEGAWALWDLMPKDLKPTFIKVHTVALNREDSTVLRNVQFDIAIQLGDGEEKVLASIPCLRNPHQAPHTLPGGWATKLHTQSYAFTEVVSFAEDNGVVTALTLARGLKRVIEMRIDFLQGKHMGKIEALKKVAATLREK